MLQGKNAKKMKKQVEDAGLVISGISNHARIRPWCLVLMGRTWPECVLEQPPEKIKFGTESMLKCARVANELEIPAVVAFSGMGNFGHFNDWPYPDGWKEEEEAFVQNWVPIFDKFSGYGVKITFEPHPNNIIYDLHTTKRCLALCDNHPAFAINFDPANFFYTGINLGSYIDEIGDRIVLVHAKDCELVVHNMMRGGYWMLQRDWGTVDRSFQVPYPWLGLH